MKYLLMMWVDPDVIAGLSEQEQQQIGAGHQRFMESAQASGEMLSTHALADPSQTVVVRAKGAGGGSDVTEGPFAETKEMMGGYYLLDVESRDRAVELAQQLPDASIEGLALEIRPVMFSAGPDL